MRRRSPERVRLWRDVIDAWKRSGQTVNAFCRDRKLTRSNFDRWRRILASQPAKSRPSPFVRVRVVADPTAEIMLPFGTRPDRVEPPREDRGRVRARRPGSDPKR